MEILWILMIGCMISFSNGSNLTKFNQPSRTKKALSIFQIVRFPNSECSGSGSYNGTCYTSSECLTKGGTASGECASGFGVCCVFSLGCGGTANTNCSYFVSSSAPTAGACSISVCKCSSDICQIRIDFISFVIAGPSTITDPSDQEINGNVGNGIDVSGASQCQTDSFSITGPVGSTPPVICGNNNDQHIYVDATDTCNLATFQLGQSGVGTTIPTRSWNLKITQLSCFDTNLAPSGCTQYYFGSNTGTFQSFNYNGGKQLANQNQRICFRRERGICRMCFDATAATDFAISGKTTAANGLITGTLCCAYGADGMATIGYDCVMIPGASRVDKALAPNSICGNGGGLVTAIGTTSTTVCTSQAPFMFNFITDGWTRAISAAAYKGFKLNYFGDSC